MFALQSLGDMLLNLQWLFVPSLFIAQLKQIATFDFFFLFELFEFV